MLADRALKIAMDIVSDYRDFNITGLLSTALTAGQSRGSGQYASMANNIIEGFSKVSGGSVFNRYPPELYQWLQGKSFSSLLPPRLATKMIAGFSGDAANHVVANETSSILVAANALLTECKGYIEFSKSLDIRRGSITDGSVSIDLSLPADAFGGMFSGLIESYRHFDRIFQITAEMSGATRNSLLVYKASSSIITTALIAVQEHYLIILSVYGGIVEVAQKTINLYKTINEMRSSKIPDELIRPIEESGEKLRDAYMEEMINEIINRLDSKIDEGRKNELKNELRLSSRAVIDGVINGARIDLSIENFTGTNLASIPIDTTTGQSVLERVQQIHQIEHAIELVKNSDPDAIKAITSQNVK